MLLASLVAIAAGALFVVCLIAVVAVLIVAAQVGSDGTADLLQRLQFDLPLRTRLGAATISALYFGLAVATLAAARLAGGRHWRSLVAIMPLRRMRLRTAAIPALTLAYAVGASFVLSNLRHRQIVTDGPTDYVLAGTIIGNLGLLAPVAEELLFRGWLYTALRARWGVAPGFVITAILFAAMHWDANHRHIVLVLPLALALGAPAGDDRKHQADHPAPRRLQSRHHRGHTGADMIAPTAKSLEL